MVSPSGVKGLRFEDEASTANALIPQLRAQGADVIVVAIHEGGYTNAKVLEQSCSGINGDIVPILERLDPAVDVVVSGHTHQAYVCDYGRVNPAKPFLLTSAGQYGTLLTDIQLRVDTRTRRVVHTSERIHMGWFSKSDKDFFLSTTTPEGIARMKEAHPDVPIVTASVDSHLNDHGYIVPGLGDAGDRMFGTK